MSDPIDIVERMPNVAGFDGIPLCHEAAAEITRLRAALAAQVPQWLPIESAPKDGRKIIVIYVNHNGKTRTVMARWLTQEEVDEIDHEGVGLEAGWFECIDNWSDYTEVAIHEGEPTHWQKLPAAPGASPPAAVPADGLHTAARLACEATADQLPMALDALRDHLAASPPAAPADPLRKAPKFIDKHTAGRTASDARPGRSW